jgi:hypothetical protein
MTNIFSNPSLIEPAWDVSSGRNLPMPADVEAIIEEQLSLARNCLSTCYTD